MEKQDKFEHVGQFAEGCTSGVHLPGQDPILVMDGNLTKFVSKCVRCGINIEVSADLNLNKYLQPPQDTPSPQRLDMPESAQTPQARPNDASDPLNDPTVRALLGLK